MGSINQLITGGPYIVGLLHWMLVLRVYLWNWMAVLHQQVFCWIYLVSMPQRQVLWLTGENCEYTKQKWPTRCFFCWGILCVCVCNVDMSWWNQCRNKSSWLQICVYVCLLCTWLYVYTYTYLFIYSHIFIHIHISIYIHVYTYACLYIIYV